MVAFLAALGLKRLGMICYLAGCPAGGLMTTHYAHCGLLSIPLRVEGVRCPHTHHLLNVVDSCMSHPDL